MHKEIGPNTIYYTKVEHMPPIRQCSINMKYASARTLVLRDLRNKNVRNNNKNDMRPFSHIKV